MKFKLNPLTGEFDYTSESANKQKLNPLTGEFNLVEGDGPFSQIFNPLTGNFNLGIAAAVKTLTAVMSVQFSDGKENGLKALIAHGGIAQAVGATPDSPQGIKCNNGVLKVRHQSGLPLGYKKLLSIYNGTNAILDTGIKLASTDRVETRFFNLAASQYGAWYGVYAVGDSSAFYANGTYYGYDAVNNKINTGVSVDTNGHSLVHDFVNGKITLDGVDTLFTPFEFTNSVNNKLFCRYYNNSYGYYVKGWLSYYKVYRNDVLILDLVPCTRESDNTVGMYDLVGGTFIGPDEGYTFEEGTVADDPIEMYVDGAVETIVNSLTTLDGQGTFVSPNPASTNRGYKKLGAMTEGHLTLTISSGWEFIVQGKNGATGGNVSGWVNTFDNDVTGYSEYGIAVRKVGDVAYQYTNFNGIITFGGATAANLLKVGDVYDEHEILSGHIKRKIGVVVLTGAETWEIATASQLKQLYSRDFQGVIQNNVSLYSTIAPYGCTVANRKEYQFGCYSGNNGNLCFQLQGSSTINTLQNWKDYLAAQYANGTPVIVAYPMATPVTEDYGLEQEMIIGDGVNDINISQSELEDLELTVKYLSNNNS